MLVDVLQVTGLLRALVVETPIAGDAGATRFPLGGFGIEWSGNNLIAFDGHPRTGDQVFEAPLQLLAGTGRDPLTGDPIGLAFPAYKSAAERIEARTAADLYAVNAEARVTIWYQIRF